MRPSAEGGGAGVPRGRLPGRVRGQRLYKLLSVRGLLLEPPALQLWQDHHRLAGARHV